MTPVTTGLGESSSEAPAAAGPRRPVLLVAGREVRQRVRARSFQVTTVISLLAVAAAIVVPHVLRSAKHPTRIALVGALPPAVTEAVAGIGSLTGAKVRTVAIADRVAAEAKLRKGEVDVALESGAVLVKRAFAGSDNSERARVARALASAVGLRDGLEANGIDVQAAQRALASPPLPIQGVEARTPERSAQRTTALFGSILLYVFLGLYGSWILTGVVEEKTSRVVEVLLATLRPRQLFGGKVLGIGTVALFQGLAVVATALVCAAATGSNYLNGANLTLLGETFAWFLLGFALYATLFGAAGSLVTRQEEAQNAAFPVTAPLLVAYFTAFTALPANHGNSLLTILSFVPLTAPISMPVRVAVGAAGPVDVAVAVALMLVGIVAMANLAGAVYAGAILRTGKKAGWREVLRAHAAERRLAH